MGELKKDTLWESVFSFCQVGPGESAQVSRLGSRCPHPLSQLACLHLVVTTPLALRASGKTALWELTFCGAPLLSGDGSTISFRCCYFYLDAAGSSHSAHSALRFLMPWPAFQFGCSQNGR